MRDRTARVLECPRTYDTERMRKVNELTPLEPFNEIGAAYNCLKSLLWIVYNSRLMCFGKIMDHISAIVELLQDAEAGFEGGKGE